MPGVKQPIAKKIILFSGVGLINLCFTIFSIVGLTIGWLPIPLITLPILIFLGSIGFIIDAFESDYFLDDSCNIFPHYRKKNKKWIRIVGGDEIGGYYLEYKWFGLWVKVRHPNINGLFKFVTPEEAQIYANERVDEYLEHKEEEKAIRRRDKERKKNIKKQKKIEKDLQNKVYAKVKI